MLNSVVSRRQAKEHSARSDHRQHGELQVHELSKVYGRGTGSVLAFEGVSFTVADGEFVSVVGPSGCGKSSLLHTIAGLDAPTSGEVRFGRQPIPPGSALFGYMFQKDLLMPWRRIIDNVALGLMVEGERRSVARGRAMALLQRYGLGEFAKRYPAQLSGGMRQRAALIRTLLVERPILLLDEPFGALDALTRSLMQEWLLAVWTESRKSIVFVTHDLDEAIFVSDRVLLMSARPGHIKENVKISLPRPRSREVNLSEGFVAYKRRLVDSLHAEGVRALGISGAGT